MKRLLRWSEGCSWFDVAFILFSGYLLTLPLKHTAALNNICLYASLLAVAVSLWRREVQWPRADGSLLFLVAYALVAVLAIAANQVDASASFRRVRGDLLEQFYVLGFALLYLRNRPSPLPLLAVMVGGFVLLTGVTLFSLAGSWLANPLLFSTAFHLREIAPGYGLNAQFYLPILVGGLAIFPLSGAKRFLGIVAAMAGYLLAIWYNSTSGVILISLYLLLVVSRFLHLKFRVGYFCLVLIALLMATGAALSMKKEGYQKILAQADMLAQGQYFKMLSLRGGIWAIGVECAKQAPWYGYGYGQKKVALLCSDDAYVRPARESGNPMADYFRKENYGKVSFHNQYLENWLLSGWLGSAFWLAFFAGACRSAWAGRSEEGLQQLVVLPGLVIFLAGCFFNGLWEGQPMAKGIMVILALALYKARPAAGKAA